MTFRKYLVLAGITVFSTLGDSLLARGMKDLGGASLHNISALLLAVLNPFVTAGIILLIAFFASYMSALSWADLTYVLPATSLSYVLVAVIARIRFHEEISPTRWLGIALISAGVGFVAAGPSSTTHHERESVPEREEVHS
ncbi:MAG TPA: EamA family transporter [Terriglobales bacterium]|nr:EamA family transporter [Terriglobales bacterium]